MYTHTKAKHNSFTWKSVERKVVSDSGETSPSTPTKKKKVTTVFFPKYE